MKKRLTDTVAYPQTIKPDHFLEQGKAEAELAKSNIEVLVIKNVLTNRNPCQGHQFFPKEGWDLIPMPQRPFPLGSPKRISLINIVLPNLKTQASLEALTTIYRNINLNWELMAPWTGAQVKVPVKFSSSQVIWI